MSKNDIYAYTSFVWLYFDIFRSASSSRNRKKKRKKEKKETKEKVSNSNNLLSPASTCTLILDTWYLIDIARDSQSIAELARASQR